MERKNLISRSFSNFIPEEDQSVFYLYRERLKNGTKQTCELKMLRRDGTTFYARLEGMAVSGTEDKPIHLRIALLDITDRKSMEEALLESNFRLSKRILYETIVRTVTQSVHGSINIRDIFENAVDAMSKNIEGVDNVSIYMVEGEEAVIKAYRGYPDWFVKRLEKIPYPKGFTWKAIIGGKPIYCADVNQDTVIGQAGREMGTKSYAAMPIHFKGKSVGCIDINSLKKNAFSEDELRLLDMVAQQIEIAINNAQQAEELRKAKEDLEIRVRERTQELTQTNEELKKEIIERKRVEDALRESERRFALFMQNLPGAAWIKDIQGRYVYTNKIGEKIFCKTLGELLGRTDDEIFPVDTAEQFRENDRSVVMTGQSLQTIETLPQDDGLHYSIVSKFPILDQNGNLIMIGGIAIDITERKQAEEEIKRLNRDLKRRLDELQTLLDVVPVGIAVAHDPECKTITVNLAAADMLGVDTEENISKSRLDVDRLPFRVLRDDREVPPEELPMQYAATHNAPIRELELDIVHDNGRVVNSYEYASPLYDEQGNVRGCLGVFIDITERKRAEQELRESLIQLAKKNRYETIINTVTRSVHQSINLQEVMENAVGAISDNIDGVDFTGVYMVEGTEAVLKAYKNFPDFYIERAGGIPYPKGFTWKTIIEGKPIYCADVDQDTVIGPAGRDAGTKSYLSMPISFEANTVGTISIYSLKKNAFDEEELKLLETVAGQIEIAINNAKQTELLRESGERYQALIENSYDLVVETGVNALFMYVSPKHKEVLGYSPTELIGREIFEYVHSDDRPAVAAEFERAINAHSSGSAVFRVKGKDGQWRWLESKGTTFTRADGEVRAVINSRDITERKRMEEELAKAQRLESIGVLAGGISHDFNNLLTAILGNISLARTKINPEDKAYQRLVEAEKACLRASDLTQQLLTFSKGGAPIKRAIPIGELIRISADFALRNSSIKCEFSIPEDLWLVEVDEGQIGQVINSLVTNADEAMPSGGAIRIKVENVYTGAEEVSFREERYVKITVEDEGVGIAKEYLPKIFDPYFTTKQKGSGLGLAVAYSIIKNHDGYIGVESEVGVGTKFYLYLPASAERRQVGMNLKEAPASGKGRILIKDDEEIVREFLGEVLDQLGYEVELTKDGAEAIDLYRRAKENNRAFDAVIMDLTVPTGMGGKETIIRLLEIDDKVKVIASSGYSNDPVMSDFKKYGFRGAVAKPYNVEELIGALYKVLNEE